MSFQHHVLLVLSCVLLVLLVQAPGTWSRPSTEETDTDFAPRWVNPQKMKSSLKTVCLGLTVKFQCQATGNPVPTLHWFKNGKNIMMDQRQAGIKIRDSSWTLKIQSVFQPDIGNYTCVVENIHGRLEHTFQLDVVEDCYSRPVLEAGLPANQTAVVGSDVTFKCKAKSDGWTHMQWLKHIIQNGSRIGPDGYPYVQVLQDSGTEEEGDVLVGWLTLKNLTLGDAGEYTCLVGNSFGISFDTAQLTVIKRVPSVKNTGVFPHVIRWAFNVLYG